MEWISVEDRLPDNHVNVLASDGVIIFAAYWADDSNAFKVGGWEDCFFCGGSSMVSFVQKYHTIKKITHWMALPELPNKEKALT